MRHQRVFSGLKALGLAVALSASGCRIEKVRSPDTASAGNEPVPGIASCGISPGSHVSEDGLGVLRIGTSFDAVRSSCAVISEHGGANDAPMTARIDLGSDTATTEFVSGVLRRITLYHSTYRTADSLGVGTGVSKLMSLRQAAGITERNRLYAVTPAYCGLRFMLVDPAPAKPSVQSGRAALRRLSGETRTRELEIVGCQRRR
jgi:hypothetical protein